LLVLVGVRGGGRLLGGLGGRVFGQRWARRAAGGLAGPRRRRFAFRRVLV